MTKDKEEKTTAHQQYNNINNASKPSIIMIQNEQRNNMIMTQEDLNVSEILSNLLKDEGYCSGVDEAKVIAETILEQQQHEDETQNDDDDDDDDDNHYKHLIQIDTLVENIGVDESEAKSIINKFNSMLRILDHESGDGSYIGTENSNVVVDDDEDEDKYDEDLYLVDGECELCDRYIKLTKHHLVPKETWSRLQTKLMHAAEAKEKGDVDKALTILGHGLADRIGTLSTHKSSVKEILHGTCDICRQCHNTVHRTHSNMELAMNYNTVEKLLEDENISKFCRWASKQRPGRYSR